MNSLLGRREDGGQQSFSPDDVGLGGRCHPSFSIRLEVLQSTARPLIPVSVTEPRDDTPKEPQEDGRPDGELDEDKHEIGAIERVGDGLAQSIQPVVLTNDGGVECLE